MSEPQEKPENTGMPNQDKSTARDAKAQPRSQQDIEINTSVLMAALKKAALSYLRSSHFERPADLHIKFYVDPDGLRCAVESTPAMFLLLKTDEKMREVIEGALLHSAARIKLNQFSDEPYLEQI